MKTLKNIINERFDMKRLHKEVSAIKLPGFESDYAKKAMDNLLAALKKAKKFSDYEEEYETIGDSINRPDAIKILKLVDKFGR